MFLAEAHRASDHVREKLVEESSASRFGVEKVLEIKLVKGASPGGGALLTAFPSVGKVKKKRLKVVIGGDRLETRFFKQASISQFVSM